jgi:hypothetical protein
MAAILPLLNSATSWVWTMYPAHRSEFLLPAWPLHRLRLKSRETSNCSFLKIADLTIDEAYAHKYLETVSDVHHFKTSNWKDVKVSIYI